MNEHESRSDKLDALLQHALRKAPFPHPPAHFARDVARQIEDMPEQAGVEHWLVRVLLAVMTLTVVAFTLPVARHAVERILQMLDGAPWPLLLAVAVIFGGVKLLEIARLSGMRFH